MPCLGCPTVFAGQYLDDWYLKRTHGFANAARRGAACVGDLPHFARIATLSVTKIIHVVILSPIRFGVAEVDVVAPEPQGLDKFCSGKLL